MQLRHVRVQNIRSYESGELDFGPGTTLLAGDVGSGKTSLLYAIEMALFGTAEVNGAYLVRHGAGHAEVSVSFGSADHTYEISRRFRRLRRKGQETFEADRIRFTVDGSETAYSATELRRQVIDLLGFPDNPNPQAHSDLWRWAVYVPQERMREILAARPQDRLETVRRALGVERYRAAAENAQELASDLRRSATARRAEADRLRHFDDEFEEGHRLLDRLRVERVSAEQSVLELRTTMSARAAERDRAEAAAREAEANLRELRSLQRETEVDQRSLEEKVRVRSDRCAEEVRRTEELRDVQAEADGLPDQEAHLASADLRVAQLRRDLELHEGRLRSLGEAKAVLAAMEGQEARARADLERSRQGENEARAELEASLREGPAKEPPAPTPDVLSTIEGRLTDARGEEAGALQRLTQAESALSEVDELLRAGECPRCGQPVNPEGFATHRAEAAAAVEAEREKLRSAEAARNLLEETRKARERYERALERWGEVEKRRTANRATLERAARVVQETAQRLTTNQDDLRSARARLEELLPEESRDVELRRARTTAEQEREEGARGVERSRLAVEQRRGIEGAREALRAEVARVDRELVVLRERLAERGRREVELRSTQPNAALLKTAVAEASRALEASNERLARQLSTIASLEAQQEEADRRVRSAESGRRERVALVEEATDLTEKASWVGTTFRAAVLGMEQKLLAHAQAMFEREFARYFASLVDDPGLVARTDPAFTPLVMIEGEWTPAEALSGGERTSLALAFRLALAHVVRSLGSLHLDTILLDEPTDGFSPEQVLRMGELLEELSMPQVVLVSHESQLAAIADRVVRVQKVDGRSSLGPAPETGDPPATGATPGP